MKRAKDRLTGGHLAVGVIFLCCLVMPQAFGAKATSLFRTTSTTTLAPEAAEAEEGIDSDGLKNATTSETTTSKYTGIPQKDYIYDPNLPRELNGYNLSSYPFLSLVPPPEQMSFKCDGLHDGFYADTEFKCQIYHHCLYGVRVDFLCANYTAFDQKTFICHFVSQVDCVNSHKYYSKNDDLYQATTARPVPTTTTTTTPAPPPPPRQRPGGRRRPSRRRRPQYDYYDDEYAARDDDYYEDERPYSEGGRSGSRRRNKRPRPAQRRPAYDDEDYEDERYARRPAAEGRTRGEAEDYEDRRSYDRPRKQGGRRPAEERERPESRPKPKEEEEIITPRDKDYKRKSNRPPLTSTTTDSHDEDDDRRDNDRPRRPLKGRDDDKEVDERPSRNRPLRDDKPSRNAADKDEDRYRDERPSRERPRERDEARERPYRNEGRNRNDDRNEERMEPTAGGALVKPTGGSIFSKPRVAPKIARPVPSSEKDKFKYVTQAPTTAAPSDEEYYDDYEMEDPKSTSSSVKSSSYTRSRPDPVEREKFKPNQDRNRSNFDEDAPKRLSGASGNLRKRRPENIQDVKDDRRTLDDDRRPLKDDRRPLDDNRRPLKEDRRPLKDDRRPLDDDEEYDDFEEVRPRRPVLSRGREDTRYPSRKKPVKAVVEEDYYEDEEPITKASKKNEDRHTISTRDKEPEEEEVEIASSEIIDQKPFLSKNKETVTTTTSTTTEAATTVKSSKGFVRVVKRPFLPSRGGSPYLPRGLQAVGGRNGEKTTQITTTSTSTSTTTSTTTEKPSADYNYESDYDTRQGSNERDPAENYSAEYIQGYQSYEENERPKDISSGERNFDKQISYVQSKQKADEIDAANNEANSNSDRLDASSFEKDSATPSGVSNYRGNMQYEQQAQEQEYNQVNRPVRIEKDAVFKPSPQISDPYKPTNKPFTQRIPENISIKQNLADIIENDYDVTLNDALNPTIPNLTPVRNYPSPFGSPDRDYTFARFRNNNNYQDPGNVQQGNNNYQYRNQNLGTNNGKYNAPRRYLSKNTALADSSFAASETTGHGVSVRTPESYYIQQPKYQSGYTAEETNAGLRPSHHVNYRHVSLGDYYVK